MDYPLRRPALFLCLFLASALALADDVLKDYPAARIAPHTYVIQGPMGYPSVENQGFMNNPAFVLTRDGVVVIDPGSSVQAGRMVLRQIRKVTTKPVTHVLDTHVHGDHWLGNQAILEAYPKAILMAHPDMIRQANDGAAERWVSFMEKATDGFTRGTRAAIPPVAIDEGQELKAGGMTFRIYAPANAHSHTDMMILQVEDSVLFGGDNLLYKRIARMDDGTFAGSIAACDKAIRIGAKHYVPGHGPAGDITVAKAYRGYLSTLLAEVKRQHEAGKADFEMKEAVVAKLGPYRDWVNFNDEVGRHISLAALEIEGESF
jgi:glyoxylase-like metal-dependent hydrolase (beta-lactamase superfamily II)